MHRRAAAQRAVGLRDGAMALVGLSEAAKKPAVHRLATVVLITLVNGLACFMKDLGLVTALGGAILGSALHGGAYTQPSSGLYADVVNRHGCTALPISATGRGVGSPAAGPSAVTQR